MTEEVQGLIREVAEEKGLDEDWINNDSYGLPEVTEIIGKLEWITDNCYSNIMLYIAKIESLLLLKVRAVHFTGLVPRITDQADGLDILAFLGIHTIEEVRKNPLTIPIQEVKIIVKSPGTAFPIETPPVIYRRLLWSYSFTFPSFSRVR